MKLKRLLFACFSCLILSGLYPINLFAQSQLHISLTTGYEITQGYSPGYDLTLLYNNLWGVRYSIIPDVQLTEKIEIKRKNDSLSTYRVEGDLEIPMLLRTIDYRAFNKQNAIAVDFITAYVGIGYREIKTKLKEKIYSANGATMTVSHSETDVDAPVMAVVMGLYMGEKFVVIDSKLLYLRGEIDSAETAGERFTFDHWLIQLSAGVFF